jgi:hypothetical protein
VWKRNRATINGWCACCRRSVSTGLEERVAPHFGDPNMAAKISQWSVEELVASCRPSMEKNLALTRIYAAEAKKPICGKGAGGTGLLEYPDDEVAFSPRYEAVMQFIGRNPVAK